MSPGQGAYARCMIYKTNCIRCAYEKAVYEYDRDRQEDAFFCGRCGFWSNAKPMGAGIGAAAERGEDEHFYCYYPVPSRDELLEFARARKNSPGVVSFITLQGESGEWVHIYVSGSPRDEMDN